MEVVEMTDYGNAPEIYVDGIGRVEFVGPTVRICYFSDFKTEKRLVLSLRWNLHAWLQAAPIYRLAKSNGIIAAHQIDNGDVCPKH